MRAISCLILAALVGLVSPLVAQVDPLDPSARDRARTELAPEVFESLEALATERAEAGLPVEPLYQKALEGAAKGVPADRLLPAVSAYADRLQHARSLLGAGVSSATLVAGVDALARGVPETSLRRLEPDERRPVALVVLGDLVESGVPADHAVSAVREAMAREAGDEAMLSIPAELRRLIRNGRPPIDALEEVRRTLRRRGRGRGGIGPPAPPGAEPLTRGRRGTGVP